MFPNPIRTRLAGSLFALSAIALAVVSDSARACPFCSAPTLTLSEQAAQSDVVILAAWQSGTKGIPADPTSESTTTFEISKVLKGPFKKGDTITLAGYQPAQAGDFYLLTGLGSDPIQWDIPSAFSKKAFDYMAAAPAPQTADGQKVPARQRLPYYVTYLESPDEVIANDAYSEFANAPYDEIVAVREELNSDKLRKWVLDPATPPSRLGLYGLLLGLSGDESDAQAMKKLIAKPTADFRIGLDGVISGYLLLAGEPGLALVRELKLENEYLVDKQGNPITNKQGEKVTVPFSEVYAAMQAVRFMWDYGNGQIGPETLRKTMRVLLERPALADLAIADLARWKDWGIQDRLFKMYNAEAYQTPSIKRSIIRYFRAAMKDKPEDAEKTDKVPEHVSQAGEYYAAIKKKDPEMVKSVERFLILVQ